MRSALSMATRGRTVLVIDALGALGSQADDALAANGFRVVRPTPAGDLPHLLAEEAPQVVVLAARDTADALRTLEAVRSHTPLAQAVLCTPVGDPTPPATLLERFGIHAWHPVADGASALALRVGAALATHDAIAQLHIAERLKTELLANVSHEFRTPLAIIIGYIELLREGTFGDVAPEATVVVEKVFANASYLLELVEEFLDLSKVETGVDPLRSGVVGLTPFLRELGDSFALLVRTRPVEFRTEVPEGLPAVHVDPARLRVVIQNLLSNAVKFTREGHVGLAAAALAEGKVAIRVSDSGPGIPAENLEDIFDLFHQLRPTDVTAKGWGLGLALARRFARMMGGDITVESTVGRGTTFTLMLPTTAARALRAEDFAAI